MPRPVPGRHDCGLRRFVFAGRGCRDTRREPRRAPRRCPEPGAAGVPSGDGGAGGTPEVRAPGRRPAGRVQPAGETQCHRHGDGGRPPPGAFRCGPGAVHLVLLYLGETLDAGAALTAGLVDAVAQSLFFESDDKKERMQAFLNRRKR